MNRLGAPLKLTPDTQTRIEDALLGGNTRRPAALLGGISTSTFYSWRDETVKIVKEPLPP